MGFIERLQMRGFLKGIDTSVVKEEDRV